MIENSNEYPINPSQALWVVEPKFEHKHVAAFPTYHSLVMGKHRFLDLHPTLIVVLFLLTPHGCASANAHHRRVASPPAEPYPLLEYISCWNANKYLDGLRHQNSFGKPSLHPPGLYRTRVAFDEYEFCRALTVGSKELEVKPLVVR